MELPIFQDNLRSSAGWAAELAAARERWQTSFADADARARLLPRLRRLQIDEARRRSTVVFDDEVAGRLQAAAEMISAWVVEPVSNLDPARLHALYRVLSGTSDEIPLRRLEAARLGAAHDPAPAVLLPRLLDNAFDWFGTQSFAEIHPIEQATLVHLRLTDLQPYPSFGESMSMLAASFYTERAGLPPVILFGDEVTGSRYAGALDAAFRMLTQPLVELLAENLARTIETVLDAGD